MVRVMKVIEPDLYNKLMAIFREQKFRNSEKTSTSDQVSKPVDLDQQELSKKHLVSYSTAPDSPLISFDKLLEHARNQRSRKTTKRATKKKQYNKQRNRK